MPSSATTVADALARRIDFAHALEADRGGRAAGAAIVSGIVCARNELVDGTIAASLEPATAEHLAHDLPASSAVAFR